jgi:outer membrane immunogenic protein
MKTKFAAAAILLASTSLGSAADLAVKAPYAAPGAVWNWTGFYLGANAGAGWGTTEASLSPNQNLGIPGNIALTQNSRSGFLGGGQFGYNFQSGWAVFGVEGSIDGLDVKGTTPCLGGFGGGVAASCTAKSNWLATVTGRIGGVVGDRTLVYVKGGAAWLNTDHTFNAIIGGGPGATVSASSSSTAFGWVLGLGTEYAFDHNWSAFVEYNYMDFDKKAITLDFGGFGPGALPVDIKNKLSVAKVGVNYKFGGPIVAKY